MDTSILIPRVLIETARNKAIGVIDESIISAFRHDESISIANAVRNAILSVPINEQLVPAGVMMYYALCEHEVKEAIPDIPMLRLIMLPLIIELEKLPGVKAQFDKLKVE